MDRKPIFAFSPDVPDETDGAESPEDTGEVTARGLLNSLLDRDQEYLVFLGQDPDSPKTEHAGTPAHRYADIIYSDTTRECAGVADAALALHFEAAAAADLAAPCFAIAVTTGGAIFALRGEGESRTMGDRITRGDLRARLGLAEPGVGRAAAAWDGIAGRSIPKIVLRQWYPILLFLVLGRVPRRTEIAPAARAGLALGPATQATHGDFPALMARTDALADVYGQKYRSSFVGRFVLSAIVSVFAALTIIAYPGAKIYAFALEFGATVTIIASFVAANMGGWQARWLTYRYLSESLRIIRSLPRAAGQLLLHKRRFPDDPISSEEHLVDWCARQALVNPETWAASDRLHADLTALLADQVAYQTRKHAEQSKLERRLGRIGLTSFVGSMSIALLALVASVAAPQVLAAVANPVSILLGILPAIGASIFAIRIQSNFRSEASQASLMLTRLEALRARLQRCTEAMTDELDRLALQTARLLQEEFGDWQKVQLGRGLALPA